MGLVDMALATVLGAMLGVYLLRHAQASTPDNAQALQEAIMRRDQVARALDAVRAAIIDQQQQNADEMTNITKYYLTQPHSARERASAGPKILEDKHQPELTSMSWTDFPCALREFRVARVTRTCEVSCRDDKCGYATSLCARLVECEQVLVRQPASKRETTVSEAGSGPLSTWSARLVRNAEAAKARDASLLLMQSSKWWNTKSLHDHLDKARTYLVVSYGGCGSKMLAGWLSSLGTRTASNRYVKRVYHLHDSKPPDTLREIPPPRALPSQQRDFRARNFPGGGRFRTDTQIVQNVDDYRVLFIFKDPVEALVSRYGYGHCLHLKGDCGPSERDFPKLDAYARARVDRMGIINFFDAYTSPSDTRTFPILLLNYHKLWDNLPALMRALGLPKSLANTFPERTETVRNDFTAAAENNMAHSEATRRTLDQIYEPVLKRIRELPAVSIS